MSGTPPKRLYKVELFVEVPDNTASPSTWNWDVLLNDGVRPERRTPVTFVLAHETKEGKA